MLSKSERYGLLLDKIINPIPVKEHFPLLEGTGVEFYGFKYKPNTTRLKGGITPEIYAMLKEGYKRNVIVDVSGEIAFSYRVDRGFSESPIIQAYFDKVILRDTTYKTFKYINDWVKTKQSIFNIK